MLLDRRFELFSTLILSLAAVMTAWAAFQSTKWSGVQADNYSQASAARVESTRASTRAGQLTIIDADGFTSWVAAIAAEQRAGTVTLPTDGGIYQPTPGTESGFLYERFREEFRIRVDAWLATRPLIDPDAPPNPFAMPEYDRVDDHEAAALEQQAEERVTTAREANQRGDNYVLMTILFATVMFFAGIAPKMNTPHARVLLLGMAVTILLVAAIVVISFPKEI